MNESTHFRLRVGPYDVVSDIDGPVSVVIHATGAVLLTVPTKAAEELGLALRSVSICATQGVKAR